MAGIRGGARVVSVGKPVRKHDRLTMPIHLELRVLLLLGDDREYEIGWISKPSDLPDLLRAAADEIEVQVR